MEIRGERECRECETRWSYFETGSITCPTCGSSYSVGVGERAVHTDEPTTLDLTPVRAAIDEQPLTDLADEAASIAKSHVRERGFVTGGTIRPLTDEYLIAAEIAELGRTIAGTMRVDDDVEWYFLEMIDAGETGERPTPEDVPEAARGARGRSIASVTEALHTDLRKVLDSPEPPVSTVLSSIRTHRKRIDALDGDVDPADAESLVRAVRDLLTALREDDETALARATERL